MVRQDLPTRRTPFVLGGALIALGIVFLAAQQLQVDLSGAGWPLWVILPGVVIAAAGLAVGGSAGSGFTAVGSMVTMTGLLLFYQDQTGHWESWAYAWALVAPGAVGAGLLLHGLVTGRPDLVRGGATAATVGVAIFLVGALFFEVVLGIGGRHFGQAGDMLLPAAVIALGILIVVAAFVPGWMPGRAAYWSGGSPVVDAPRPPAPPLSGTGPAAAPFSGPSAAQGPEGSPPAGATGAVGAGPSGEDTGPSTASAWASSAAAGTSAGSLAGPETLAFDLGAALQADVQIEFGAGRLSVAGAGPGRLVEGSFSPGSVRHDVTPNGQVRLSSAVVPTGWAGWPPHEWRVGITTEVPGRMRVATGASETELDLTEVRVAELNLKVGASETRVRLPRAAGSTVVDAEVGAARLLLQVPPGVAARIRTSMTLGSNDIDTKRFPPVPGGFASPDYDQAQNRVQIEFRGGIGSLEVR